MKPYSLAWLLAAGAAMLPIGSSCPGVGNCQSDEPFCIIPWQGEAYQYKLLGQCDLAYLSDDNFADGLGLHIHTRTKNDEQGGHFAYIEEVAIRIGEDTLEVGRNYHLLNNATVDLVSQNQYIGGFPIIFDDQETEESKKFYTIDLDDTYPDQKIVISVYEKFLRLSFPGSNQAAFEHSTGLLGDPMSGELVGREGENLDHYVTLLHDFQVLPTEPQIFHNIRAPQYPESCIFLNYD